MGDIVEVNAAVAEKPLDVIVKFAAGSHNSPPVVRPWAHARTSDPNVDGLAGVTVGILEQPPSLKTWVESDSDNRRHAVEHAKIERRLGWQPRISLEKRLRARVAKYRAHRGSRELKNQALIDEYEWQPTRPR